jgi:hypothetical protein
MRIFVLLLCSFCHYFSLFASDELPFDLDGFVDHAVWEERWADLIDLPEFFANFSSEIGDFDSEYCKNSVLVSHYLNKNTNNCFSVYETVEDSCDGGNAYGLIMKDCAEDSRKVVAFIQDYEIVKK